VRLAKCTVSIKKKGKDNLELIVGPRLVKTFDDE